MKTFFIHFLCFCCWVVFDSSSATSAESASQTPATVPQMSLAYRYEAMKRMLDEANYYSSRLSLPAPTCIEMKDLKPNDFICLPKMGFGGVLRTTNLAFVFYKHGKIDKIRRTDLHEERFDLYPIWAKTSSLVDSNGAYQLATQWLNAVMVDVPAMKKKYRVSFYQWFYWKDGTDATQASQSSESETNKVLLPVFDVKWGDPHSPAVLVSVFGPTKEMLVMELNDISLSRRPPIVISNWQELLNTPDPPVEQLRVPKLENRTNLPPTNNSKSMPAPVGQ